MMVFTLFPSLLQMEVVSKHFEKTFDKTGVALTGGQLYEYAKSQKLGGITKRDIYNFLSTQKDVAQFGVAKKRGRDFTTISIVRPGIYHIDYGEFHKEWAGSNSGHTGFLVAVENFTNKLFVLPTRGKDTEEWYKSITNFVEKTRNIRTLFSDRDSVATSPNFRLEIMKRFNIRWFFLRKGHKAYLAERYIGFIKTKLNQALLRKGGKKWVQFVQPICDAYNTQKIEGTSYRRSGVMNENFSHFLQQLLKTSEPELTFNAFKAGPFQNQLWNRKIFKFDLGQRVLIARRANWQSSEDKLKTFSKISEIGGFGKTVYTVGGRQLRSTKGGKAYVPLYSINELGPSLHFYTHELKPAPLL
jgi:hypothetical protein